MNPAGDLIETRLLGIPRKRASPPQPLDLWARITNISARPVEVQLVELEHDGPGPPIRDGYLRGPFQSQRGRVAATAFPLELPVGAYCDFEFKIRRGPGSADGYWELMQRGEHFPFDRRWHAIRQVHVRAAGRDYIAQDAALLKQVSDNFELWAGPNPKPRG